MEECGDSCAEKGKKYRLWRFFLNFGGLKAQQAQQV